MTSLSSLQDIQSRIELVLTTTLDRKKSLLSEPLNVALRYTTLGGGKRIRAALVYFCAQASGGTVLQADFPAVAVELIHAYSLVHDDLPAMDNDDFRRGKPTAHKVYGEGQAILVGDALQTMAFEVLSHIDETLISAKNSLSMIHVLASASGVNGMVVGQLMDIEVVGQVPTLERLENIHAFKTGALIRASARMGCLAANAAQDEMDLLDQYANKVGLAFQVWDDVLDVIGETQRLGKKQGADANLGKPTYPALIGLDAAKKLATQLQEEAIQIIEPLGFKAKPLRDLARFLIARDQ